MLQAILGFIIPVLFTCAIKVTVLWPVCSINDIVASHQRITPIDWLCNGIVVPSDLESRKLYRGIQTSYREGSFKRIRMCHGDEVWSNELILLRKRGRLLLSRRASWRQCSTRAVEISRIFCLALVTNWEAKATCILLPEMFFGRGMCRISVSRQKSHESRLARNIYFVLRFLSL